MKYTPPPAVAAVQEVKLDESTISGPSEQIPPALAFVLEQFKNTHSKTVSVPDDAEPLFQIPPPLLGVVQFSNEQLCAVTL